MNQQLKNLIDLSDIDGRLEYIGDRIEEIPHTLDEFKAETDGLRGSIERTKEELNELVKKRKKTELDIQDSQNLLNKYKRQSLEVKTNREYSALMAEIDITQDRISDLEEEYLIALDRIEEGTAQMKDLESRLEERTNKVVELETELAQEQNTLKEENLQLVERRAFIISHMDATTISRYEKTREHNDGKAVVVVKDGLCQGCFVNLPPQLVSKVHLGEELQRCPSCARFLYAPSKDETCIVEDNLQ